MACERGQASVEWVALVLLVCLAVAATLALALPGAAATGLMRAVGERLVCAASLGKLACRAEDSTLVVAYGGELGELVRKHAPRIMFEQGSTNVPVDFRRCRRDACAEGRGRGSVVRSRSGHRAVLFTRVIDCREPARREPGVDCSGGRAGSVYIHYWAYLPTSDTWADSRPVSRAIKAAGRLRGENLGHHPDDWESLQIRVRPDGAVDARASSHHGYNHRHGSVRNWLSDAGLRARPGWGPATGRYYLTWGSNAGGVEAAAGGAPSRFGSRHTPRRRVVLRPLEPIAAGPHGASAFEVSPPWRKDVWLDPEATGT